MSQNEPAVIQVPENRAFDRLVVVLIGLAAAIVLLDAFIVDLEWVSNGAAQRLFNITREDGIPNFFSSFQFLAVGFVLLLITLVVRGQTRGGSSKLVVALDLLDLHVLLIGSGRQHQASRAVWNIV